MYEVNLCVVKLGILELLLKFLEWVLQLFTDTAVLFMPPISLERVMGVVGVGHDSGDSQKVQDKSCNTLT